MPARWALPASLLASLALAGAVVALVLGRDDLPTATYLVYTSEEQPLPRGGIVETPSGERVRLLFEEVRGDVEASTLRGDVAGIVLDAGSFAKVPRESLRSWRSHGAVLAVYGVDAIQIAVELEIEPRQAPGPGAPNLSMRVSTPSSP